MIHRQREYLVRLLQGWTRFVQCHPWLIISIALVATAGILAYSVDHFRIDVDVAGMISDRLRFRKLDDDYSKAFPNLTDTIVVILEADGADLAISSRERLAGRLRRETGLFKNVYEPGGGNFFAKNGLLYLSVDELEDFSDSMAAAQPLMALLSRDMSVRGLFSVVEKTLEQPELQDEKTDLLIERMGDAVNAAAERRHYTFPWQELMQGGKEASHQRRQFLILQPFLDSGDLAAGEIPLNAVRDAAKELGIAEAKGVRLRITGDVALNAENLDEVRNSVGLATFAALLLVSVLLYIGLAGSGRLIVASLVTLLMGLIWTTGFAIVFIGSLNMISVTFAVLFIGLGIDYSIQFCLRYRELVREGLPFGESIFTTVRGVGRAILLSCITTAIGFYSFIPTAYSGVAQLGLISGTGMFISFFANLTILPALLAIAPYRERTKRSRRSSLTALLSFPYRHSAKICVAGLVLGLASAALLPKVYFDYNPLNLYDPSSEPVAAIKELFADSDTSPWTISILARGETEARELAERLAKLREVKMAVTLFNFLPENQREKCAILSDISFLMPPQLGHVEIPDVSFDQDITALDRLESALERSLIRAGEKTHPAVRRLHESLLKFRALIRGHAEDKEAFGLLEEDLLSGLPALFRRLEISLQAAPFTLSGLPEELVRQYRSADGRYRVQVFPSENILDRHALRRFVEAVQSVSPNATDAPVTIYESGKAVVASFEQAALYAVVAIIVVLLIEMRSLYSTVMILVPLMLAMLLTASASVLFKIPLNFADVIVVPLLLGTGVHSGIIFMIRHQTEPPADGNMLKTSTARAVLFSNLTTMISTGSLSFSSHRGMASIGILLTICFSLLILSALVLLPALLNLTRNRDRTLE